MKRLWAALLPRLGKPFAYLAGEWERMAPRERRTVTILSSLVGVILVVIVIVFVVGQISDVAEHNADVREALEAMRTKRDDYVEAKARSQAQEVRIGNEPPQLQGDLEAAAKDASLQIQESSERPVAPAGRHYQEHDVDLKLRGVGLVNLTTFLRRLETGPRLILVTRLSMKRKFGDQEKLDVEMTATAFEKVKEAPKKKGASGASKGDKGDKSDKGDKGDKAGDKGGEEDTL